MLLEREMKRQTTQELYSTYNPRSLFPFQIYKKKGGGGGGIVPLQNEKTRPFHNSVEITYHLNPSFNTYNV